MTCTTSAANLRCERHKLRALQPPLDFETADTWTRAKDGAESQGKQPWQDDTGMAREARTERSQMLQPLLPTRGPPASSTCINELGDQIHCSQVLR